MWFQVLSFVIALALIGKATVALIAPRRFYARRRLQYDSETLPPKLLIPPVVVLVFTGTAWFGTIIHYQPWSWLVTGFLSAISGLSFHHLFRWTSHRQAMIEVVANPKVTRIDWLLLVVGLVFLGLAVFVF